MSGAYECHSRTNNGKASATNQELSPVHFTLSRFVRPSVPKCNGPGTATHDRLPPNRKLLRASAMWQPLTPDGSARVMTSTQFGSAAAARCAQPTTSSRTPWRMRRLVEHHVANEIGGDFVEDSGLLLLTRRFTAEADHGTARRPDVSHSACACVRLFLLMMSSLKQPVFSVVLSCRRPTHCCKSARTTPFFVPCPNSSATARYNACTTEITMSISWLQV